ncbi:MAG TPA: MATE family efflux transporter, partial [Anaeromyxobacteraceae bacterium]|nr:MATE family efflux transporter [Anaeromyxobacteraceae bacterium]
MTDTRKRGVAEELSALWRLAWPLALANAAQSLMGVVDAIILGRAGAAAQGGGGIAVILFWSLTMLGVGVMLGLDPLISQAVGAGDRARARHLLWQGVWLACAVAAGLAVPMALVPSALVPLGINADLARQASGYLLLRLPSLPFLLFFYAGRSYLQAHGAARAVLATAVAANLVHVPVDLL